MSSFDDLRESVVSACWRQWRALGAALSGTPRGAPRSVVDVEALILTSLAVSNSERRLRDAVAWWAVAGSRLVSVQRLRTMQRRAPAGNTALLATFAEAANRAGDRRWRHLTEGAASRSARATKGPEQPRLAEPAALMPRLRAAFGVGAKADVLVFLLTTPRPDATARDLAVALDYTPRAVREAAEDMALSGLIEAGDERPRRYAVQRQPWRELLVDGDEFPAWRPWNAAFELVSHLLARDDSAGSRKLSPYMKASSERDLVEEHARRFGVAEGAPRWPQASGADYSDAFDAYVAEVAAWIDRSV